jgi:signal transduction histidine kinase
MTGGWIKPLVASLTVSLLLSALFVGSIALLISKDRHVLYLRLVERSARIVAIDGDYAANLQKFGPVPEDSSGFLGRLWVVSSNGRVLASSSSASLPDAALALLPTLDRSTTHPLEVKTEPWGIGADVFLLPMPGHPDDTYVVQNLRRGPMARWLRIIVGLVFGLSFALALSIWATVIGVLRHQSRDARAVMQAMAQGELGRRLTTSKLDRVSGLSLDFNAMADRIEILVNKLKQAEESRSELLRHLAHDIRTPLTSLRTATETLKDEAQALNADDRASLLQVAHAETLYLGRLVEDLFYLSELGVRTESKEPVDLADLTSRLIEQRRISTTQPQLHWEMDIDATSLMVEMDTTRFTRLLGNLLDNAEKYARHTVRVRLNRRPQGFRLAVCDDGPGMSPEAIEQYGKDRHTRIDLTQASTASLGLGSAIVHSIVDHWEGTLTLGNRPEGGLEVVVELPGLQQES